MPAVDAGAQRGAGGSRPAVPATGVRAELRTVTLASSHVCSFLNSPVTFRLVLRKLAFLGIDAFCHKRDWKVQRLYLDLGPRFRPCDPLLQRWDNICFELNCVLASSATLFGDGAWKEVTKVKRGRKQGALDNRTGGVLRGRGTDPRDLTLLRAQRAGQADPGGRWLAAGREDRLCQKPGFTAP